MYLAIIDVFYRRRTRLLQFCSMKMYRTLSVSNRGNTFGKISKKIETAVYNQAFCVRHNDFGWKYESGNQLTDQVSSPALV